MSLKISANLSLPLEAVTWVLSYLAKRGAGKTYCASVQAEEMLKAKIPIVVIDGMGIWWGLRVSADRQREGLPVVVFGGEHADLPLFPEKAGEMAKAIVESNISCVLDLSPFSKYVARKIVAAFLNDLYRLNRVERHVFIEESDLWAPQRPIGQEEALCLSAVDNFVRRGGNHNLGCTLITQRSAVLNKDILTQSDCLVVLRTLAPQDKKAIQAWVEEQTEQDKTKLNEWYDSLKTLENGEAWVWRPEKPAIFQKVKFRQRETFHATREFIRSPQATKIVLMSVDEFVERFKKVFGSEPLQTTIRVPGTRSPEILKELEEFRSGHKLAESVQQRLKFQGEMNAKLNEEVTRLQKELGELQPLKRLRDALLEIMPTQVPVSVPTNVDSSISTEIRVSREEPIANVITKKPILDISEENWKGRLLILIHNGYFDEPKRLTPIRERLQQNYGAIPNAAMINNELVELMKLHFLSREQQGGQWVYVVYPGAKERIRETS